MAAASEGLGGIVTPEAVRLQFKEANVGSRAIALIVDAMVLGFLSSVVNSMIGFALLAGGDAIPPWVVITTLVVLNFVVVFGYPIVFETLGGRTPGKQVMGLRVVTVEGAPVRFRHAVTRAALWLIDVPMTVGMGAVFATLASKRHQRLGDMVAGTVVLRERTAEATPWATRFTVPAGAESYAATIDASGVTPREYEVVRSFLLRARTLAPQPRREIGERLATALAVKLHHRPPATVSAELFLSCLVARYQERHLGPAAAVAPSPSPSATAQPSPWTPPTPAEPSAPPPVPDAGESWGDFTAPSG